MYLMVSFLTGSELVTMIALMVVTMMVVVTSIGKKVPTMNRADGRNREDCNFSWLARSVS